MQVSNRIQVWQISTARTKIMVFLLWMLGIPKWCCGTFPLQQVFEYKVSWCVVHFTFRHCQYLHVSETEDVGGLDITQDTVC
jgi:hypothetical protein